MEILTFPNCRQSIWLAVFFILWTVIVQVICIISDSVQIKSEKIIVKNFLIYYWVDEENFKVQVIAVIYNRRDQLRALMNMDL